MKDRALDAALNVGAVRTGHEASHSLPDGGEAHCACGAAARNLRPAERGSGGVLERLELLERRGLHDVDGLARDAQIEKLILYQRDDAAVFDADLNAVLRLGDAGHNGAGHGERFQHLEVIPGFELQETVSALDRLRAAFRQSLAPENGHDGGLGRVELPCIYQKDLKNTALADEHSAKGRDAPGDFGEQVVNCLRPAVRLARLRRRGFHILVEGSPAGQSQTANYDAEAQS